MKRGVQIEKIVFDVVIIYNSTNIEDDIENDRS